MYARAGPRAPSCHWRACVPFLAPTPLPPSLHIHTRTHVPAWAPVRITYHVPPPHLPACPLAYPPFHAVPKYTNPAAVSCLPSTASFAPTLPLPSSPRDIPLWCGMMWRGVARYIVVPIRNAVKVESRAEGRGNWGPRGKCWTTYTVVIAAAVPPLDSENGDEG